MRNTATERSDMLAAAGADVTKLWEQINAAEANGFRPDTADPARISDGEHWYRTQTHRLVLRGLDGAELHAFKGEVDTGWLDYSIRFDGNIPAEAFEGAIRGAM